MKIAFIILCHKNPNQINDLIKSISDKNIDIYIHLDKKSNIQDEIIKDKNIFILPKEKSVSVSWGSNDMIKATLKMIECIKNSNIKYDYVWLISGQDYPIVKINEMFKRLDKNNGYNYIEIIDQNSNEYNRYKKLYELWYPKWITQNKVYIKIIKRIYMVLTGGFRHTFSIFKRKKPFDFEFYFGSQWWTLTSDCAYDILAYCKNHKEFINYFENSIIPDECFFQTLFMNTKYNKNRLDNLTYVNWGKNRRSPETLLINDYDKLKKASKSKIFARKFDYDVDMKIVNKIKE